MNRRLPAIVALLVLAAAGTTGLWSLTRGTAVSQGPARHRIDLVANVTGINMDIGWSMEGGSTREYARFVLDDLRVLTVAPGTSVAGPGTVPQCTDFATPRACVLLADMLGEAIVWFALVPANTGTPAETLELPGIVDMQANGDEGILPNGWVVRLATPTKRVCPGTDTSSLRDFITRFPADRARSLVDMRLDHVSQVECVE